MDKIRTFIAVRLPAAARRRLAEVEEALKESGADVKWVSEENLHITLKFLGYVENERMAAVCDAVKSAVDGLRPFDMSLSGVGAFPKPARPSVVWVGVRSGSEELKALAKQVEVAMERIGFAPEPRKFSAHVTVGRVKSAAGSHKLREAIERLRDEPVDSARVSGVAVMKSELYRTGPVYTVLKEFGLE